MPQQYIIGIILAILVDNIFIAGVCQCNFMEAQNLHCIQTQGSKNIIIFVRTFTCPEEGFFLRQSTDQSVRLPGQQKGMQGDNR